eukprot:TRINITY_DN99844_c0_g1_i1.p1 TRINITY_DN99844_c0_g1~~TRINITY_DN99844_c0_g1_i1.p1  ORF type:complete len:181 (+),score=21.99 TRINITY_DN99844_c0_g1_i1:82-543(+)
MYYTFAAIAFAILNVALGVRKDASLPAAVSPPGTCDDNDMRYINQAGAGNDDHDEGSFPWIMKKCAKSAYSFWRNSFDRADFTDCITKNGLRVRPACADCLADPVEYGCKECKSKCYSSSCDPDCITCVGDAHNKANTCAGHTLPTLTCPSAV